MKLISKEIGKTYTLQLLILILATACVGTSPKENFYTLNSQNYELNQVDKKRETIVKSLPDVYIDIVAVTIIELVDRPQLVIKLSPNQVQILEQQRWAQPLKNEIGRVVAKNLSTLLNTHYVTNYPTSSVNTKLAANLTTYKVQLNVQQFESNLGSNATVTINYSVRKLTNNQIYSDTITNTQKITGKNYSDLVEAQSKALGTISHEIAQAIANMASQ